MATLSSWKDSTHPIQRSSPRVLSKSAKQSISHAKQMIHDCLVTHSGKFNEDTYFIFWKTLSSAGTGAYTAFLGELLETLLRVLDDEILLQLPISGLTNTIYLLCLYSPITPDRVLKVTFNKWKQGEYMYRSKYGEAVDVVTTTNKILHDKSPPIHHLISQCISIINDKAIDIEQVPTLHDQNLEGGEFCFVFHHIKKLAKESKENLEDILSHCIKQLDSIALIRMPYETKEVHIYAFLHLFTCVLKENRIPDADSCKKVMTCLRRFFVYPSPVSNIVRDVLTLFKEEVLAPGTNMLKRYMDECRSLKIHQDKRKSRSVYYMMDASNQYSHFIACLLDLQPFQEEEKVNLETSSFLPLDVAATLILNMINFDAVVSNEDIKSMRNLTEADIYDVFDIAIGIFNIALSGSFESAKESRRKGFRRLRGEIRRRSDLKQRIKNYKPSNILPHNLPQNYLPGLPNLEHFVFMSKKGFEQIDREEIFQRNFTPSPITSDMNTVLSILRQQQKFADPINPAVVQILVCGDDRLLHSLLCCHIRLKTLHMELLKGIKLAYFLVPFTANHLASFLARHDPWYSRHIYIPFRSPVFLVPHCEEANLEFKNRFGMPPPGRFLLDLIEDYIREGSNRHDVTVFKVDGWINSIEEMNTDAVYKKPSLPDQSIPFIQRIELGEEAYNRSFKEIYAITSTSAAKLHSEYYFSSLDVDIQATLVTTSGVAISKELKENKGSYRSVVLSHVPWRKEDCYPSNPSQKWLEMKLVFSDKHKLKRRLDPNQHVKSVEFQASSIKDKFTIVVDDVLFGPFYRVVISPLILSSEKVQATFPIQTFFPIRV